MRRHVPLRKKVLELVDIGGCRVVYLMYQDPSGGLVHVGDVSGVDTAEGLSDEARVRLARVQLDNLAAELPANRVHFYSRGWLDRFTQAPASAPQIRRSRQSPQIRRSRRSPPSPSQPQDEGMQVDSAEADVHVVAPAGTPASANTDGATVRVPVPPSDPGDVLPPAPRRARGLATIRDTPDTSIVPSADEAPSRVAWSAKSSPHDKALFGTLAAESPTLPSDSPLGVDMPPFSPCDHSDPFPIGQAFLEDES